MSEDFLASKRRFPVKSLIAAAAVVGLVAVAFVAGRGSGHAAAAPGAEPAPTAVPRRTLAATPSPSVSSSLQLVTGNQDINGVHVGFPDTESGAFSAAVEYMTDIASTLDPDRSATIARLVAAPAYTSAQNDFAQGIEQSRLDYGLPESGPVPQGAALQLTAVQYQVKSYSADNAEVLLLGDLAVTLPNQGTVTHVGTFPVQLVWSAGDWKFAQTTDTTDYRSIAVQPDSAQAAADGWTDLPQ
jgi:hypothetical protein